MSFASDTKAELSRIAINKICCAAAEAYGVLLYCNTFSYRQVRIITENRPFASRLPKLFNKAFGIEFDTFPESPDKSGKQVLSITEPEKLRKIFDTYGYDTDRMFAHHINFGVLEEEHCRASFLRGAFLAGGSVTDPEKRYHLEIVTAHYNVSRETMSLFMDMGFYPKETSRGGNYILYFKHSEAIEDFLTTIGAPVYAMEIMSAKVMKDLRNSVNRRVNCDTANVEKTISAAIEHIEAIEKLMRSGKLDNIPEKIRQTALLRLEHPEASIAELAVLSEPPVSKSCLSHRLRKLMEISKT